VPVPELIVCGNASSAPPAGGACASYLPQTGASKTLLDIGPGSLANIRTTTAVHDLDSIVISHMHTDHFLDLLALNAARLTEAGERTEHGARWRLPVFVPPGASETVAACFQALQVNVSGTTAARWQENLDVRDYNPAESLSLNDLRIDFVGPTKHSQLDYGRRITTGERVLGYTGDTAFCDAAIEVGRGADLFVAECTLMEPGPQSSTHTCASELIEMTRAAKPARLLATHFINHTEGWRNALESRLNAGLEATPFAIASSSELALASSPAPGTGPR
jgi:ribonuclease BN (tRNA processing enzyme)